MVKHTKGDLAYYVSDQITTPHAFSTRTGGVSPPPFDTLNLGPAGEDSRENILENYARFCSAAGVDRDAMVFTKQVHGNAVRAVGAEEAGEGLYRKSPECDGLITGAPGLPITVFGADCVPILLYDPIRRAAGAVHAGWRGTASGVVCRAVSAMKKEFGTNAADLRAAVGPSIGTCCYTTRSDVQRALLDALSALGVAETSAIMRRAGREETFHIDLKAANAAQMVASGVRPEHIDISDACTCCQPDLFFSHRRSGARRGLQAAVIAMLLVASLLILSSCQGLSDWLFDDDTPSTPAQVTESAPPIATPTPPQSNLFGISWSGQLDINPLTNDNRFDALWLPLVYEGLFQLDASFQPQPLLCLRYKTEDNATYTFTLRSDVFFHNGERLTAEDAAWSLNTAQTLGGPFATRLSDMVSALALDDTTLEVVLSRPNPRLPALLNVPIVPADSGPEEIAPGTGPYVPNLDPSFPHLELFHNWWQRANLPDQLPLDLLALIEVSTGDQLIYAFEARTLSLVVYNPSDIIGVRFRGDFESWEFDTAIMEFVGFNTVRSPMSNPLMRQAISAAIDRMAIVLNTAEPRQATTATLPIHPSCPLYNQVLAERCGYDPARVGTLLGEMGYEDLDEDGVLEIASGRRTYPLELTMVVCVENARHTEAAREIAAMLESMGVLLHLRELPSLAYHDALEEGDFDLYYGAVSLTADFSPLLYFEEGSLGFGGFADPEIWELWEEAAAQISGTAAVSAFWERFMEQAPLAPVLFQRQALFLQRGLTSDPRPVWENVFYNLSSWKMGG